MTDTPTIYDLIVRACVNKDEWPAEVVELSQEELDVTIDEFLKAHPVTDNKSRRGK